MSLLLLPIGLLPTTALGWLLLRLLEGRRAVLLTLERWTLAILLGLTTAMTLQSFANIALGIPFSLLGFLEIQGLALALSLLGVHFQNLWRPEGRVLPAPSPPLRRWGRAVVLIAMLWIGAKVVVPSAVFLSVPPAFDDTVKNWNLRAKVFFETKTLTLTLPSQRPDDTGPNALSSYPPTVSLAKTWLATLRGQWDEALANSIHFAWLLASLSLLYCMLRRRAGALWSLMGVYVLTSLPLYLMHGTNAYADVFLSAHLLAAVSLLFSALHADNPRDRSALLRLAALAIALLTFTKNEALVLYLPILIACAAVILFLSMRQGSLSKEQAIRSIAWFALALALTALPWTAFKWTHGLTFGNAKGLWDLKFAWQPNVLLSMWINTFFEANWLLLFPLFLLLVAWRWRSIVRSPLLLPLAVIFMAFLLQLPLYLFTGLSTEVLYQTGYARGLIHLAPLVVCVSVLLVREIVEAVRAP